MTRKIQTPYNHLVPKDPEENLKWRARVYAMVAEDPEFAEFIYEACWRDPLFFINGFCWTSDPRREPNKKLPFVLYPFQEEAILDLINCIGTKDVLVEKSRDMGASWLCVTAFFYLWMFRKDQTFLFVSRTEDYVDSAGNPKSLFWKFDYLLDNLAFFLRPRGFAKTIHRRKCHIENPETGSVVDGEATTGEIARGDRRTAIMLDEFAAVDKGDQVLASTRDATDSRIFNSTPKGTNNAFYRKRQQKGTYRLRLHWTEHPIKSRGLYTFEDGKFIPLDKEYWDRAENAAAVAKALDRKIAERGVPLMDGKLRSPWYALQCERAGSAQEVAQELDIDYLGSGFQFFSPAKIQAAIQANARPPVEVGNMDLDWMTGEPIRFDPNPHGNMKLWVQIDGDKNPICPHRVFFGVDISAGTGSSNSCLAGYDSVTRMKVCEYTSPYIRPEAFAAACVAIMNWFRNKSSKNGFIIWESAGPGRQFGSRLIELGWSNYYLKRKEESLDKKVTNIPGFAPTKENKLIMMGDYRAALEGRRVVNTSKLALEETLEYVYDANGGVSHTRSLNRTDPSGALANHGDRVIADALAWKCFGEVGRKRPEAPKDPEAPIGSLAWRIKQREMKNQTNSDELGSAWG
jgi:hypothetical protein